jgi:hypothetical protein
MLFDIIHPNLPRPDIILYLYAPVERLMIIYASVAGTMRRTYSREYLQSLQQAYLESFQISHQYAVSCCSIIGAGLRSQQGGLSAHLCLVLSEKHPVGISYL